MPAKQMRRAASAPWCGSALMGPDSLCAHWLVMPCRRRPAFHTAGERGRHASGPPQVPADAEASGVVDSTLAEPAPAAAALGSAPHDSRDVGSESEVPDFAQWWHAAMRFAIRFFADLCRPPPQRAAAPEIFLHMRVQRDPNTSYPRMPGWIQRNRSLLAAINMMKCLSHQVFRGYDRGLEHLRFRWLRQSRNAQAGSQPARRRACDRTA